MKSPAARYGLAVVLALGATLVRGAFIWLGFTEESPFLLFPAAIVFAAWFGGFGPGVVATVITAVAVDYFFLPPRYELWIDTSEKAVDVVVYLIQGVAISGLGWARWKARTAAKRLQAGLEHRVQERTGELAASNEALRVQAADREMDRQNLLRYARRLDVSNQELEDFASVASHDLQEPLRKIRAFGDRLAQRAGEGLDATSRDYLKRMLSAAERMQVLITDLLQFSRITTKARPFEATDLNRVLAEVVSDLEARIEQTGGKVEAEYLPTIEADGLQMRQLMQNLIANALKFRAADRAPVVRVYGELRSVPAEGEDPANPQKLREVLLLHVADNGIGFDEKYLDRVFNVFQRLHGRREYEGTGIGLAVCRKIALRHGGDITARSRPGEGSTFIVTLPLQQPGAHDGSQYAGETHYDLGR